MKIWFNYYFLFVTILVAQPRKVENGIEFSFKGTATSVALAGDFNSWQTDADLLKKDKNGTWRIVKKLISGVYQYKFVIDGHNWRLDENNPIKVPNYNNSDYNSIITITDNGYVVFKGYEPTQTSQTSDNYPKTGKTLYLNIIWHQHQPLYLDPQKDQLQGPWVRTHGTKDYYDMAAMVEQYPNVHFNVNLTSSLLYQLQKYYVERLAPYYDANRNRINTEKYFSQFRGKTDPWIDLALKPTKEFNEKDKAYLLTDVWNAFGISEVMISRFPQYSTLKNKLVQQKSASAFSEQELRDIKFWFYLAYFDPDFLRGKATLPDGSWIDLTDLVEEHEGPTFYLKRTISEDDCNRIIAETYKVMSNIIPIHRKLMYNPVTFLGQIEIVTTPFYHPILPLIYDSDLAKICQPKDALPKRFSYPQDAFAQVAKSVVFYEEMFGRKPQGMWPAEG